MRPLSSIEQHSTFAHKDTLFDLPLCTTMQLIFPFGTSSSGHCRTSMRPLSLAENHLTFTRRGTPVGRDHWKTFARYLRNRFTRAKQLQDREELFSLYAQLVHAPQTASSIDLSVAGAWIRMAENFQHPTILLAYETSLRLLVQRLTTLPSLPQHLVILRNLTSSLAVGAFSACLRKRAPGRAVELLEQGRGVFWSQLTRLHSPLDDVVGSSPAGKTLADEFTRLALLIRNALNSFCADQHERLCHLNYEMQKVVTGVRELPGFSRFLLPLLFRTSNARPVGDLSSLSMRANMVVIRSSSSSIEIPFIFPCRLHRKVFETCQRSPVPRSRAQGATM